MNLWHICAIHTLCSSASVLLPLSLLASIAPEQSPLDPGVWDHVHLEGALLSQVVTLILVEACCGPSSALEILGACWFFIQMEFLLLARPSSSNL